MVRTFSIDPDDVPVEHVLWVRYLAHCQENSLTNRVAKQVQDAFKKTTTQKNLYQMARKLNDEYDVARFTVEGEGIYM